MNVPDARAEKPNRYVLISALGVTQILAWGSSYYLLAVLARPIADETGWPSSWIVGGLSFGLLVSAALSPWVGRVIAASGGRAILASSAPLLAAGLALMGLASNLPLYFLAWAIIGAGMGMGLYDPAFSILGRIYGHDARGAITALTLFGGFASTVCWPLSAYLVSQFGWRDTCLIYASIHFCVALPVYLSALPRDYDGTTEIQSPVAPPNDHSRDRHHPRLLFALLTFVIAMGSAISATLSVHLLTILQAQGITLAIAVGLGALVGPAQVGARLIQLMLGRHHHPVWTKIASSSLVAAGLCALWSGDIVVSVALISYGAGIGLDSIARGTLPLAIFGPQRYPTILGKIAAGNLFAQAVTPILGAWLIDETGANATLSLLAALAAMNVGAVYMLYGFVRKAAPVR